MRDNKELAEAVMRRAAEIRLEKTKRRNRVYTVFAAATCIALVAGLSIGVSSILPGAYTASAPPEPYSGTLIVGSEAGGYVIVAIAAFALGICFTLLCLKLMVRK